MANVAGVMQAGFTDIPARSWLDLLPKPWRGYGRLARWDRPVGIWLLLLPGWWAIGLAAPAWPDARLLLLFLVGAIAMRGAGCTINDILDRDLDAQVERTRLRPLPSGAVSVRGALVFLVLQLLAGFLVLIQLNPLAIGLGCASLLLVFTYPLMKRVTWWPQVFLGIAFSWSALVGWAAATGGLDWPVVWLMLATIAWTVGYDTIYSFQDIDDDTLIGVRSSGRRLGAARAPLFVGLCYALTMLFLAAALIGDGVSLTGLALLASTCLLLAVQLYRWRPDYPPGCLARFKANVRFGMMVWLAIVIGRVLDSGYSP